MSSPMVLSLSTVFALIGIVLVAIAFGTDNWVEYKVNRNAFLSSEEKALIEGPNSTYYDRSLGLFRECYTNGVPSGAKPYMSPLGSMCKNIKDYQIPEEDEVQKYSENRKTRMHLMRTTVGFYIVGLALLFFCLFTGIAGCWRRSPGLILTTGIFLLFATLFLAAAMAVWHGVDYLEREVIEEEPFYKTWSPKLRANTTQSYGWSYMISWIGIGFILIASILMLAAYRSMKEEEREDFEKKRAPYMMPNYYDKSAMVPYGYANYGYAYPGPGPYAYGTYGGGGGGNGYYGYMTYGR